MAGYGLGFGTNATMRARPGGGGTVRSTLAPGASWTGLAGSGFNGNPPVDPVRTTAKPALRLLVPPNQHFTSQIVVGVIGGANNGDSLVDTLGIRKVIAHFEGNVREIDAPTFQSVTDANGNLRSYYGWWVTLEKPEAVEGEGELYFEAVPRDGSMQHRVIGPYLFNPVEQLHDHLIEVAASAAVVAGERYRSLGAALAYLASVSAQNPRITITESGDYEVDGGPASAFGAASGRCLVEANVPVTLSSSAFVSESTAAIRTRYDGLHLRGRNITLDRENLGRIVHEGIGPDHWLDGISMLRSTGRDSNRRKGPDLAPVADAGTYFTECEIRHVANACVGANLVRGCAIEDVYGELVSDARCVVQSTFADHDPRFWQSDLPTFSLAYLGAEPSATIAAAGGNDGEPRQLTVSWGANSATFTTSAADDGPADASDFKTWVEALDPGFSCTVLDTSRRIAALGLPGGAGQDFGPQGLTSTPLTVVTSFSLDNTWYRPSGAAQNVILHSNIVTSALVENVKLDGSLVQDVVAFNNAFHNTVTSDQYVATSLTFSRLDGIHEHVVFANNSFSAQPILLRTDLAYNPDDYCLVANNALPDLDWGSAADSDLAVSGQHLSDGGDVPEGSVFTSVGGSVADLFVDAASGDFRPTGALADSLKQTLIRYDSLGDARRSPTSPAGAVRLDDEVGDSGNGSDGPITYGQTANYDAGTAADYFVDGVNGNDGNDGLTLGTAKATINAAKTLALASTGSKVIAVAGDGVQYRERVELIWNAGSLTSLTIKGYGTDRPVISGADVVTGFAACTSGDAAVVGANWASIHKATINTSSVAHTDYFRMMLRENGVPLKLARLAKNSSIPAFFHDSELTMWRKDAGDTFTVTTNGSGRYDTIDHPAVLGSYSDAQLEQTVAYVGHTPNFSNPIKVASVSGGVLQMSANSYTPEFGGGAYQLLNVIPAIEQGGWGYRDNGDGTLTLYVWPDNAANLTGGIDASMRKDALWCRRSDNKALTLEGLDFEMTSHTLADFTSACVFLQNNSANDIPASSPTTIRQCHARHIDGRTFTFKTLDAVTGEFSTIEFNRGYGWDFGVSTPALSDVRLKNLLVQDSSLSGYRTYNLRDSAVVDCKELRTGTGPHANSLEFFLQCDNIAVVRFIGGYVQAERLYDGYATTQNTSGMLFLHSIFPQSGDGRAFVDQNSPGGSTPTGDPIQVVNSWVPHDVAKASTNAMQIGKSAEHDWQLYNNVVPGISNLGFPAALRKGNVLTDASATTADASESKAAVGDVYADAANEDWRAVSGGLLTTKAGENVLALVQAWETKFPDIDFRRDILGRSWDPADPGVGPYGKQWETGSAGGGDVTDPTITSADPSGSYPEGQAIGGTLTADESVTWSVSGADAGAVTLDANTGVWSLENTVYATKASYAFTFTATDGASNTGTQAVSITITEAESGGGYSFSNSEAAAYHDALSGTLTDTEKGEVDTLVGALKSAGIWPKIQQLQLYDIPTNSDDALIDLKSATSKGAKVNSPSWAANEGFTGDGSTSYIDTGYEPSANEATGLPWDAARRDAHIGVWVRDVGNADGAVCGLFNQSTRRLRILLRGTGTPWRMGLASNDNVDGNTLSQNATGLLLGTMTGSAGFMYRNTTQEATLDPLDINSVNGGKVFVLARSSNNWATNHVNAQASVFTIGRFLNATERDALHSALNGWRSAREAP